MGNPAGEAGDADLHRFFVALDAVDGDRVDFAPEQARQIRRVLRLESGDRVIVCPGDGREGLASLQVEKAAVRGLVERWLPGRAEPSCAVWLYQSALRGDRFTWLLQKGTEIGVHGFVPLRFRYTQPAEYANRLDRYRAVVREAAEQCGRSVLPAVLPAQAYERAIDEETDALRLLLDERERACSLREAIADAHDPRTVHLFVGPEGGLHSDEREQARAHGLRTVSLGRRVLRSETAGLVAATLVLAGAGDLE